MLPTNHEEKVNSEPDSPSQLWMAIGNDGHTMAFMAVVYDHWLPGKKEHNECGVSCQVGSKLVTNGTNWVLTCFHSE